MPRIPHNSVTTGDVSAVGSDPAHPRPRAAAQGRRRKRGAVVALGTLALTSGVAVAVDITAGSAASVSVGRLAITLTAHDGFKLDTCSNDHSSYSDHNDSNNGSTTNGSSQDTNNSSIVSSNLQDSGSNPTVTSNSNDQPNSNQDYIFIDNMPVTQIVDEYSISSIDQNNVNNRYEGLDNFTNSYTITENIPNTFDDNFGSFAEDMNRPRYPFGRVSDSDPELPSPFPSELSPGEDVDGSKLAEYIVLNDGEYVLRPGFLSSYPRVQSIDDWSPMYREAVIQQWHRAQAVQQGAGGGNVYPPTPGIRYDDATSDSDDEYSGSYEDSSTFDDDSNNSDE